MSHPSLTFMSLMPDSHDMRNNGHLPTIEKKTGEGILNNEFQRTKSLLTTIVDYAKEQCNPSSHVTSIV